MSIEGKATDRLVRDGVDFIVAHEAIKGASYNEEEKEAMATIVLGTLAYLSVQARALNVEPVLNALLFAISNGDGK